MSGWRKGQSVALLCLTVVASAAELLSIEGDHPVYGRAHRPFSLVCAALHAHEALHRRAGLAAAPRTAASICSSIWTKIR